MIPVGIFTFYIAGSQNERAALGFILIVVAALSLLVINRVAGTRMGGMFGWRAFSDQRSAHNTHAENANGPIRS
jgi:hypothetical protein